MKNKIYKNLVFALAFAMVPAMGSAQNLNPVVEVSKSFVGKLSETRKPIEKMAIPDSLFRFDLDFDYSVFDNPYRGAYIFSPYVVDVKPQKVGDMNKKFYLKVGAGYALRPELELLWSPKMKERFKLNVYASEESFIGKYRNIAALPKKEGDTYRRLVAESGKYVGEFPFEKNHKGFDVASRAGMNGYWDWRSGRFSFDLGYRGLHNSDSLVKSSYNALEMNFNVQSRKTKRPYFYYDASVGLRLGTDRVMPVAAEDYTSKFMDLEFDGTLGPRLASSSYFLMDFHMGMHDLGSVDRCQISNVYVTPKYVFEKNRWKLSAGVKLGQVFKSKEGSELLGDASSQIVYPAVFVGFDAIKDYLNIYLKADGGDQVNDYTSLKERNHFFNFTSALRSAPVIDNSVERYNLALGFRGNIGSHFKYNLMGGYKAVKNGLVDAVYDNGALQNARPYIATVNYVDYKMAYVDLDFFCNYGGFFVDGFAKLNFSNVWSKMEPGFEPAPFLTNLRFRYNWKNRLHVGLYAEGASSRKGHIAPVPGVENAGVRYDAVLPGYVDLGLTGEFFINRKLSAWLKADNLLNMNIQRVPLYVGGGIGFTAGICLNL